MARTRSGNKAISVKNSKARAIAAASPSTSGTSSKKTIVKKSRNPYKGANLNKFWETPSWQKPITYFFKKLEMGLSQEFLLKKKVLTDKGKGRSRPLTPIKESDESEEGSSKNVDVSKVVVEKENQSPNAKPNEGKKIKDDS